MKGILGSVGKSGKNIRSDVVLIQELLNFRIHHLPGKKKLHVDGLVGNKTIKLISEYQAVVLKMTKPDGRVDPNGKTFKSLHDNHSAILASKTAQKIWQGDSAQWSEDKKLQSMNAQFRVKVTAVIKALKDEGFKPKIFYGWRSVSEQLNLFHKKKSRVKFSFHNATKKSGQPNAYAADIIDSRYAWSNTPGAKEFWTALGKAAKEQDLYWGGDWTSFKDWAHIQMLPNSKLRSVMVESKPVNN